MKRLITISTLIIMTLATIQAQTIDEALKYSQLFYGGTARFMAMGGAFTSLGGDLSTLSQNPAGLGVFRSMEFSIAPQMYFSSTTADYKNTSSLDNQYNFNIGHIGVVYPLFNRDTEDGISGFNLGYSYNRTNNFNSRVHIEGVNNNSSMADYWASVANGTYFQDLTGPEGIVFDSWLIDTISGSGGWDYATVFSEYGDQTNSTYGQTVRRLINNEGYTGEHAFSMAANYKHKLYFGFTFGINKVFAYSRYEHLEADYDDLIFDFDNFTYTDVVETRGTGYAFKLGLIMKPVSTLRLGFAFHAPVIYRLNEYYYDFVRSEFDNGDSYDYSNDPIRFSYTMTSPLRVMSGAAIQLGKKGIISADYEFIDYKMARFSRASDDYNYADDNQAIKNIYNVAHNLRIGGEFRMNTFYLRGGYAYYGSGFAMNEDNRDNYYNTFSGGFGVRQSNFYFDLSYSLRRNAQKYFMYNHPDIDPAEITFANNIVTTTLGFRF